MAVQLKLLFNQPNTDVQLNDLSGLVNPANCPKEFGQSFEAFFRGLLAGAYSASIVGQIADANASQTLTLVYANLTNGVDIVVIGGVSFPLVASPAAPGEWAKGANLAASVANLAAAINAYSVAFGALISAAVTAVGVVTVTSVTGGVIGNLIQVTVTAGTGITAGGATLAGGTDYAAAKTYKFGY